MIFLGAGLIALSGICVGLSFFWRRARTTLWIVSFFALLNSYLVAPLHWKSFLNGTGFWLAPLTPREPPPSLEKMALPTDSPESIILKMGCYVCHKIPHIPESYQSGYGPLLIPGTTAPRQIVSPAYQRQVKAGKAKAATPREYVIESILDPSAFIVPGFEDDQYPEISVMYPHYGERFTGAALEKLADYLLTLDANDAAKAGLESRPDAAGDGEDQVGVEQIEQE